MSRGVSLFFKVLIALGILALVVWNGLVDQSFIAKDPVAKLWLLGVTGLLVFVDSIWGSISVFRKRGDLERQRDIRKALIPVLREAARSQSIDITVVGGSVFMVRRRMRSLWLRPYLARIERFRLSDLPQESRVRWTATKGAIGQAWTRREITHLDWRPVQKRWGGGKLSSPEDWESVPLGDRWGMNYHEFVNIVDKYAEILAIPILATGAKCIGVLAIDIPLRSKEADVMLDHIPVVEKAVGATEVIKNVV